MLLSEAANAWWRTAQLAPVAASEAGATGGAPWKELIVKATRISAGVHLKRQKRAARIVISDIFSNDPSKMIFAEDDQWSRHSRRRLPLSLLEYRCPRLKNETYLSFSGHLQS